jgi:hypothetical protein
VVAHGSTQLAFGVHHERAVLRDRFVDRFTAEHHEVHVVGRRFDRDVLARMAEDHEIVRTGRTVAVDHDVSVHHQHRGVVLRGKDQVQAAIEPTRWIGGGEYAVSIARTVRGVAVSMADTDMRAPGNRRSVAAAVDRYDPPDAAKDAPHHVHHPPHSQKRIEDEARRAAVASKGVRRVHSRAPDAIPFISLHPLRVKGPTMSEQVTDTDLSDISYDLESLVVTVMSSEPESAVARRAAAAAARRVAAAREHNDAPLSGHFA